MRLHRFYIKQSLNSEKTICVSPEAGADQWRKVFRFVTGDQVLLFCGDGYDYLAEIVGYDKDGAKVMVLERRENPLECQCETYLFMALVKKDTFDWIAEKATELGVSHIVPILAERSEKKSLNMERIQRILIEASEQSGRATLPVLHDPISLDQAIAEFSVSAVSPEEAVFVFDPSGKDFKSFLKNTGINAGVPQKKIYAYVGPEGGWSPIELQLFTQNNIPIYSMGQGILRAETAAVSALTLLRLL